MRRKIRAALAELGDRGASAVEYGLMVAAIAAVIVGVVFFFGEAYSNAFHDTCTEMEAHNAATDQDSVGC